MEAMNNAINGRGSLTVVDGSQPVQNKQADEVRKQLVDLSTNISQSYFSFAKLLQVAFDTRMYEDWGHITWKDFVEAELHISLRKSQYLLRIHHWFVRVLKDDSVIKRVQHLGWTKVGRLVGVVDEDNVDEWVERAENMTVSQLEDFIRELKGGKDPSEKGSEDLKTLTFKLYPGQQENIEEALELAGRITNAGDSPKRGHLLDLICTTFRTDHVFQTKPGDKLLKHYLMKLGAIADVTMIATERSGEIIVGKKFLKRAVLAAPEALRKEILKALSADLPAKPDNSK